MADVININWGRWIFASLTDHFSDARQGTNFFVENQIRPQNISDFGEFRMDGPYYNEINDHFWEIDLLAAIIINIVQNDTDIHKLERFIGIYLAGFTTDIPVYKYGGNLIIDDQTLLGCLKLSVAPGEKIRADKFGQTKAAIPVAQASIEARYTMSLITT